MAKPKIKESKYKPDKIYKVHLIYEIKGSEMEEYEKKINENKKIKYWFHEEKYEPRD